MHESQPRWPLSVKLLLLTVMTTGVAGSQVLTDTSDAALVATLSYGNLLPANSAATSVQQIQFRIRCSDKSGYHVNAAAVFTPTTTGSVSGGSTISAADIGVGITAVTTSSGVITPRSDTIASGYNYDPTNVAVTNGLTPYTGAASGRATLADLTTSRTILSGPKIANAENTGKPNYLTVTLKFGMLPQYFTPGSFTATVALTISNGL